MKDCLKDWWMVSVRVVNVKMVSLQAHKEDSEKNYHDHALLPA